MKSYLIVALFTITTAFGGPIVIGRVKPRNPIHFSQGNGTNSATTFDLVKEFAISNKVYGIKKYSRKDWLKAKGGVTIIKRKKTVRFAISLNGLIPGGFYTAWLVRKENSSRGPKADLALGYGSFGPDDTQIESNKIIPKKNGSIVFTNILEKQYVNTQGLEFKGLEHWDEIHIAFHADNIGHGDIPGVHHWTQLVFKIK